MPKKTLEQTEALRTVLQEVAGRTAVKNDRKKNKATLTKYGFLV